MLFSGGLDSLLTAKLLERQGLRVRCLHFYSPFFGGQALAAHWSKVHGLDVVSRDVGPQFAAMSLQAEVLSTPAGAPARETVVSLGDPAGTELRLPCGKKDWQAVALRLALGVEVLLPMAAMR